MSERKAYTGYNYLNRPLLLKGGLPAETAMLIFVGVLVFTAVFGAIIKVWVIAIDIPVVLFTIKFARDLAKKSKNGERNPLESGQAFTKHPKEVYDRQGHLRNLVIEGNKVTNG